MRNFAVLVSLATAASAFRSPSFLGRPVRYVVVESNRCGVGVERRMWVRQRLSVFVQNGRGHSFYLEFFLWGSLRKQQLAQGVVVGGPENARSGQKMGVCAFLQQQLKHCRSRITFVWRTFLNFMFFSSPCHTWKILNPLFDSPSKNVAPKSSTTLEMAYTLVLVRHGESVWNGESKRGVCHVSFFCGGLNSNLFLEFWCRRKQVYWMVRLSLEWKGNRWSHFGWKITQGGRIYLWYCLHVNLATCHQDTMDYFGAIAPNVHSH